MNKHRTHKETFDPPAARSRLNKTLKNGENSRTAEGAPLTRWSERRARHGGEADIDVGVVGTAGRAAGKVRWRGEGSSREMRLLG